MPIKLLSQTLLAATTLTDIFTVSQQAQAGFEVKSLFVAYPAGGYAGTYTFRLSIAKNGAADNGKQYLYYDTLIPVASFVAELSIGLEPGDVVRAYASTVNTAISLFGESLVL